MQETRLKTSPACPECGSTATYVKKRDGGLSCKACGHRVRKHATTQHECPLCRSKQVYLRGRDGMYACRRCGLGQNRGVKPAYLAEMAELVRTEYQATRSVRPCPICGGVLTRPQGDNPFHCLNCGFDTGLHSTLRADFLAALPPFREIRRDATVQEEGSLTIHGRFFSLKLEAGTIWLVVAGVQSPFAGPGPYQIPVYDAAHHADLDLTDPATVADAWRLVLIRAETGRDDFEQEFPRKLDGLTPAQMTALQAAGLLAPKAREKVLLAFRGDTLPGDTTSIGYTAMLFELGLLDRVDEEYAAAQPFTVRPPPVEDDYDGFPAWAEGKRYLPIPVPEGLPPVEEIAVSFDGGKTHWIFVASHRVPGGDE